MILSGSKFRITIEDQTIINNGETQWIFLPEINEVQILKNDPHSMMNPSKIFNLYKEDFKYNYVGTESKRNKQLEIINLFPKESQELMKINLAIDAEKKEIHRIIIYDKNGGTYKYKILSYTTNDIIKPFEFNAKEFPNVEIIDLR